MTTTSEARPAGAHQGVAALPKARRSVLLQHRRWRTGVVLILCLGLVVGLIRCSRQPHEPSEIRIGMLADFGVLESQPTVKGARLAVKVIHDAGGLAIGGHRHRVELIIEDTRNTPEDTSRAVLRLINQENVVAIVGPQVSRNVFPASRAAENARIPLISPGSTNPRTTAGKDFVFRVAFTDSLQCEVLARLVLEQLRTPTAAVLYDVAGAYSRDLATMFKQAFEAAGGQVVAFESYTTGDQDFSRQLTRIGKRMPGMLFLPNLNTDVIPQARQARRLGIAGTLVGGDGWIPERLTEHPELEGAFAVQHWHPDVADTNPEARAFIAAYRQAYAEDPSSFPALTYDAFGLLFQAIRRAGRADPESIRHALSRLEDYPGVTGTITYRGTGGDPQKPALIVQLKGGKVVLHKLVGPEPKR
ncbi:MAG: ABC transporter substrate-binding protein [bacterium]|nr:ABC transporter substrate-binding protein [bacterium]